MNLMLSNWGKGGRIRRRVEQGNTKGGIDKEELLRHAAEFLIEQETDILTLEMKVRDSQAFQFLLLATSLEKVSLVYISGK